MNKTDLWDAINHYCVACGGSPATRIYGNTERQRAVVAVEKVVCETTENAMRIRCTVCDGKGVEVKL
jgi:formate dehydrogenase maturation protein FdhE